MLPISTSRPDTTHSRLHRGREPLSYWCGSSQRRIKAGVPTTQTNTVRKVRLPSTAFIHFAVTCAVCVTAKLSHQCWEGRTFARWMTLARPHVSHSVRTYRITTRICIALSPQVGYVYQFRKQTEQLTRRVPLCTRKVRPHRTRSAAADCGLCPLRNVTFWADSFNYHILKAQFLSSKKKPLAFW